ncbi:MAG: NYN domain-containing protein [Promethearchaeota archaeon]
MLKNVLVDLSNFAFIITCKNRKKKMARYENIRLLMQYAKALRENHPGIHVIFIADATLRHRVDDKDQLRRDIQEGAILEAPAGSRADEYLLEFLNQNPDDTIIVSNDRFQDYPSPRSTLPKWRFPGMIIRSQFIIPGLMDTIEQESKAVKDLEVAIGSEAGA